MQISILVERSADGINYTAVGIVAALNNNAKSNYSFN